MWHSPYQLMSLPDFWSPLTFAFCAFWIQRSQVLRPQLLVLGFGGLARLWERWVVRGARGSVHRWFGEFSTFFSPQPPKKPAPSSPPKKDQLSDVSIFGGGWEKNILKLKNTPHPPPHFFERPESYDPKNDHCSKFVFWGLFRPGIWRSWRHLKKMLRITAIDVGLV